MRDYLIIGTLLLQVCVLSRWDKRVFGTWFTPFTLLAYPYAAVVVLAFLFAPVLDFAPLYTPSILIWIVGLFLIWWVGFILGYGMFDIRTPARSTQSKSAKMKEVFSTKIAMGLAWGTAPLMAFGLYTSLKAAGGLAQIGNPDFRSAYTYGLPAHAVVLAGPLSVYLMGTYKKGNRLQFATIVLLLFFLFISQVKGTILVPVVAAIIFKSLRANTGLPVRRIVAGGVISYVIFNAVYLGALSFADPTILRDPGAYLFLSRHFCFYLWAGVLSMGQALQLGIGTVGGPWYTIFSPFINICRALLGSANLLVAISPRELGMDTDYLDGAGQGTNVYTMFGTLYLYLGPIGTVFVVFAIACLCYGLLVLVRTRESAWLTTLYCLFGGWLFFGFFEYYFWQLAFLESTFYCLILAALVRSVPEGLHRVTIQPGPAGPLQTA